MREVRYAIDQTRLYLAERLIGLAVDIAPKDHPDSVAIFEAALHVAQRKPTERT